MDYTIFFKRKSEDVANDILGRTLLRNTKIGVTAAKIIGTAAYEGGEQTDSRMGMNYAPGTLFLMPYRGSYLLNIATGNKGDPSCVEIRKVALANKKIDGSGKVSKLFGITCDLDGILFGEEFQIIGEPAEKSYIKHIKTGPENCLGYFLIDS